MHPKSFVSNFWGAVQQCSNRLFRITIHPLYGARLRPYKASYFVTLSVVFALFTT